MLDKFSLNDNNDGMSALSDLDYCYEWFFISWYCYVLIWIAHKYAKGQLNETKMSIILLNKST